MKISVIDIFAGPGGLGEGFSNTPSPNKRIFESKLSIEMDERIENALKGEENWVLIGGPPCQAYSLVGRSRRQWKENLDNEDVRVHLYKECLRIIASHSPAVFVMENVKGLLSSKVEEVRYQNLEINS